MSEIHERLLVEKGNEGRRPKVDSTNVVNGKGGEHKKHKESQTEYTWTDKETFQRVQTVNAEWRG